MYALESVAAGFFYLSVVLAVVGTMGLARATVERRPVKSLPALLLTAAIVSVGLAIICYMASPRHELPF